MKKQDSGEWSKLNPIARKHNIQLWNENWVTESRRTEQRLLSVLSKTCVSVEKRRKGLDEDSRFLRMKIREKATTVPEVSEKKSEELSQNFFQSSTEGERNL